MRSMKGVLSAPMERYPSRPTRIQMIKRKVNDLTKTFLSLLMFGFLMAEATLKKLVRQLNAKIVCPNCWKNPVMSKSLKL